MVTQYDKSLLQVKISNAEKDTGKSLKREKGTNKNGNRDRC